MGSAGQTLNVWFQGCISESELEGQIWVECLIRIRFVTEAELNGDGAAVARHMLGFSQWRKWERGERVRGES